MAAAQCAPQHQCEYCPTSDISRHFDFDGRRETYDVENGVNSFEERTPGNAEGKVSTRLDATECHSISNVGVAKVFLLDWKLLAADVNCDHWER